MSSISRMPTIFLSHGAGPSFLMSSSRPPFGKINKDSDAAKEYKKMFENVKLPEGQDIKAFIIISAHWESKGKKIQIIRDEDPGLLYDYYGFPQETYEVKYEAKGDPDLADKVADLLKEGGLEVEETKGRGWDHGVFIPLKLMFPKADIPIVQVSLHGSLDPELHLNLGKALAPLRDEGCLIIGSGSATHNFDRSQQFDEKIKAFVGDLKDLLTNTDISPEDRLERLRTWEESLQNSRLAHPREEHFIPLHVAAGAAEGAAGEVILDIIPIGSLSLLSAAFY